MRRGKRKKKKRHEKSVSLFSSSKTNKLV